METLHLTRVLAWIEQAIVDEELLQLYDEAIVALRTSRQTSPPSIAYEVHHAFERLSQAHRSLEPPGWLAAEQTIYANLGADQLLGATADARLATINRQHRLNPEAAVEALQHLRQATQQLLAQTTQLRDGLATALHGLPTTPAAEVLPTAWTPRALLSQRGQQLAQWTRQPATTFRAWLSQPRAVATVVAVAAPAAVSLVSVAARGLAAYRRHLTAPSAGHVEKRDSAESPPTSAPVHIFNQTTIITIREK